MKDVLTTMLIQHEGLRLFPYRCTSGKLTIGVGRNIEDNGITEEEALYLLENDIRRTEKEVKAAIPCFVELDPARQIVIMNMAFNMGLPSLLGFRKMIKALPKAIITGDYKEVVAHMLDSRWADQVGDRAVELSEIMRKGEI